METKGHVKRKQQLALLLWEAEPRRGNLRQEMAPMGHIVALPFIEWLSAGWSSCHRHCPWDPGWARSLGREEGGKRTWVWAPEEVDSSWPCWVLPRPELSLCIVGWKGERMVTISAVYRGPDLQQEFP